MNSGVGPGTMNGMNTLKGSDVLNGTRFKRRVWRIGVATQTDAREMQSMRRSTI